MILKDLRKDNIEKGDKDATEFINTLYNDTSRMYLKQHRDWYIIERFVRGDHWIVYNKSLNKVQVIPITKGEIRRSVNKIKSQLRGIKNFVKRSQPRWECHPNGIKDEDLEEAKKKNKIIQNIYRTRRFPSILTDIIVNGLKYSAGILEGGVVKKEGKDYLDFWVDDTFEVLFDPFSPNIQNCRYIFKAFKKPVSVVESDYDVKDISADNKEAALEYKELLELEKYSRDGSRTAGDLETVIVKELWMKWIDAEGKVKIKIFTVAGTKLLRVFEPSYKRYPFFLYNPEKDANTIYSNSWLKDLIPLNKSLDKIISQVEAYIQRMLAGKYLIKQGVEVSSITDKGAEKIYYKGSTPPVQQNLQPLPAAPFTYAASLDRYIEELGGIREASLGRTPGGVQSGKGIEALQSADADTVAEPIENLEIFLTEVGEFILETISDYTIASETIVEDNEEIKFIGNVESPPEDATVIKPSNVKVVIVPEVAYSEEAKRDWIIRLAEAQLVDPQTVLETFSISNIGQILERMKLKKQEEFKEEMIKQKESHRTSGEGPEDTADLADQENMGMAAGQSVNPTPQALWTPEHTELHLAFIQQNQDAYQQNKELFDEHLESEAQYQQ